MKVVDKTTVQGILSLSITEPTFLTHLRGRLSPPGDALDLDPRVLRRPQRVAVDDGRRLGRHRHSQHRVLGADGQGALRRPNLKMDREECWTAA